MQTAVDAALRRITHEQQLVLVETRVPETSHHQTQTGPGLIGEAAALMYQVAASCQAKLPMTPVLAHCHRAA